MADYYSLLSRAIANLPKSSTPTARKAIYDRARKALNNQLRSLKPPLPESDIVREETALDEAVNRIEAGFELGTPAASPAAPVSRPPPAAQPAIAAPAIRPQAPARPVVPRPAAPPSAPRVMAAPLPVAAAPSPDVAEATFAPPVAAPPTTGRPSLPRAEENAPRVEARAEPSEAMAAPAVAAAPNEGEPLRAAPLLKPSTPLAAPREPEPSRPFAPRAEETGRGGAWKWAALAVALGLIGAVAVEAFLLRSRNSRDLGIREPAPTPVASTQPAPAGSKIVERVGGGEAPSPTPEVETSTSPQPTPTPIAAATATPDSTPAPTATPAAAPLPAPAGSDRAAFLLALPADVQKPTVSLGNVVWSSPAANPGQGGGPGVRADVEIPEYKMRATMLMRKNTDPSLPASHTIDLRLAFDDGAPFKGVKDVGVPQMRREDAPAPISLLGVRVVINDTYFLIGLNRADADVQRNLDAIASSNWFDFPMLLADGRIAKLTFEKGADGDKIIASALAAWK